MLNFKYTYGDLVHFSYKNYETGDTSVLTGTIEVCDIDALVLLPKGERISYDILVKSTEEDKYDCLHKHVPQSFIIGLAETN